MKRLAPPPLVIPAKAGTQFRRRIWVPAFAGMTSVGLVPEARVR
jgi:hypothetical protein